METVLNQKGRLTDETPTPNDGTPHHEWWDPPPRIDQGEKKKWAALVAEAPPSGHEIRYCVSLRQPPTLKSK